MEKWLREYTPLFMVLLAIAILIGYMYWQVSKCSNGVDHWEIYRQYWWSKAQWITVCRMGP